MGLSFSDYFDDDISYEQKPPDMLRPMEETDFPIQAKDLFAGLWENNLLLEVHLEDLYHATNYTEFFEILKSEAIKLSFAGGTESDQFLNKEYPFFLSTMREKYGNYATNIGKETGYTKYDVIIHLDGKAITAAGFKVFPVDYWNWGPEYSEQEERIVGNKDELRPLSKFIKDVHILVKKDTKNPFVIERLQGISDLANQQKFPIYFYPESAVSYFKAQKPEGKAVKDVREILNNPVWSADDLEHKDWLSKRKSKSATYLEAFMRIYNKDYSKENEFPDKNVIAWLKYYPHDAYAQLFADIHNHRRDHLPIFRDIVSIMKKEKVKNFKDLITLVIKREQQRLQEECDLKKAEELEESHRLHFDVGDYNYESTQAFCVFIIYPEFSVWFNRKNNKSTFFSNNPKLQEKLNAYNGFRKSTHYAIRSILTRIAIEDEEESIIPRKDYRLEGTVELATGRMWGIQGKLYVSFWQDRNAIKSVWNKVEMIIRTMGQDPQKGLYLFNGTTTEDGINSYEDVTKGLNFHPADPTAELRKKLHTSPDLKKALIQLGPDKLQAYADRMGITVAQLKSLVSIDEVQDAIPPEYGVDKGKSVSHMEADSIFIIYGGLIAIMQEQPDKMIYFSNDPKVEKALNIPDFQKFLPTGEDRDFQLTHFHLGQLVKSAVHRAEYPLSYSNNEEFRFGDVAARVWKFQEEETSETAVVGFWQPIEAVRSKWHQVKWALEKLNIDWKTAEFTFSDIIYKKFSYADITGTVINPTFDEKELEVKRQLHTSPQLKKAVLKLPPDKLQAYADKMDIPVVKLKQLAGSMD